VERLQKILSQAGIASRRASEQLMLDGRVTVNGVTVRELGSKADAGRDDIRVDGRRVKVVEHHRYVLLNKPRGYVSTRSDPQRRPTVIDLLDGVREYVYPVGRLDFDSEGLLLLTNDGDLAARLTHPRHGIPRVYEARVLGEPDEHDLNRLRKGVVIDGRRTEPAEVSFHASARGYARARATRAVGDAAPHASARGARAPAPREGADAAPHASARGYARARATRGGGAPRAIKEVSSVLIITIREGRNRQVRKMCDAIGHPVTHLTRIAIGPIKDPKLKPGHWRELTKDEVQRLRAASASESTPRPAQ
jgi:23S rRNA pseudouridine2605 synthase